MGRSVIVGAARTPIGKFGGNLKDLSAVQLGGIVIKEALKRGNVKEENVGEVILGTVLQGGQGQIPSRQAAREAGLDWKVKTETINKVCASGLRSITLADQIIRAGDEHTIVAGGMESMSQAPYYLKKNRWGSRLGNDIIEDAILADGLTCAYSRRHMGFYGGLAARNNGTTREEQDRWAFASHQKAIQAQEEGRFAAEIVPVTIQKGKGQSAVVKEDEGPRRETTLEKLQVLQPVFEQGATITAGNASTINDGAAAVVVMSEKCAALEQKEVLAYILGHTAVGVEAENFPLTPGYAIKELLRKTGKTVADIDIFEVNEAFASVALHCEKIAGVPLDKLNVNGGAVALGHPIGASGARIVVTLLYELKRRGGGLGIAAICSGGGQGDAILIEVPKEG